MTASHQAAALSTNQASARCLSAKPPDTVGECARLTGVPALALWRSAPIRTSGVLRDRWRRKQTGNSEFANGIPRMSGQVAANSLHWTTRPRCPETTPNRSFAAHIASGGRTRTLPETRMLAPILGVISACKRDGTPMSSPWAISIAPPCGQSRSRR